MLNIKNVLISLGTTVASLYIFDKLLDKYLDGIYSRYNKECGVDVLKINKLLTFGISSNLCNGHNSKQFNCGNLDCNYGRLCYMLSFIEKARVSVDVCIYIITAKVFGDAIVNAHNRGVRVRIIADSDMSFSAQSIINNFRLKEMPTRQRMSPYIMHHKFVIVDEEVLLNGSMNFTMTGAFCNWENVMITSQPEIVKNFSMAFQGLWDDFSPRQQQELQLYHLPQNHHNKQHQHDYKRRN